MVTIRGNLDERLDRFMYDSIQNPLNDFCSCYACAGIRNNYYAARKARGNHHGEYYINENGEVTSIPVRQFIWAAIKDIQDGNVGFTSQDIRDLINKKINTEPKVQKKEWTAANGIQYRHTTQWATPVFKGNNFDGIFKKLAEKMELRLIDAIESVNIVGSYKPRLGGTTSIIRYSSKYGQVNADIRHNAPGTISHKGFDHPLEDTGEMLEAIEGWTNAQNTD